MAEPQKQRLTRHFLRSEVVRPDIDWTDLPPGVTPAEAERHLTALLAAVVEPWRAVVGRIRVTDGLRPLRRHVALGGRLDDPGQHSFGDALDGYPLDLLVLDAWAVLVRLARSGLPVDQAILEYGSGESPSHIHVSHSLDRDPRCDLLIERGGNYTRAR